MDLNSISKLYLSRVIGNNISHTKIFFFLHVELKHKLRSGLEHTVKGECNLLKTSDCFGNVQFSNFIYTIPDEETRRGKQLKKELESVETQLKAALKEAYDTWQDNKYIEII